MTEERKPNFVMVDEKREPASEALQILTLDTPSRSIQPDMMNQLQQLMKKEFGYA
jgi:hypothetical protein